MKKENKKENVQADRFTLRKDAPLTQYIRSSSTQDVSQSTKSFYTEYQVNRSAYYGTQTNQSR